MTTENNDSKVPDPQPGIVDGSAQETSVVQSDEEIVAILAERLSKLTGLSPDALDLRAKITGYSVMLHILEDRGRVIGEIPGKDTGVVFAPFKGLPIRGKHP